MALDRVATSLAIPTRGIRGLSTAFWFFVSQWRFVAVIALLIVAGGELYFRLPFIPQRLEYQPDADFGGMLHPRQRGYVWLANMSLQSPPITLNGDGHRGGDTDWSRPVVLVLGDSEWFGAGVEDREAWTSLLQADLRRDLLRDGVQVVNAAHPGFGPGHMAVVLRRLLAAHHIDVVLVRVDIHQSHFRLPAASDLPRELAAARRRQILRRVTKFGPYLFDKVEAQRDSLLAALVPLFVTSARPVSAESPESQARAAWREMEPSWRDLADLAVATRVPLVFVVHDVEEGPASRVPVDALTALVGGRPGLYVTRIDAQTLGLGDLAPADRKRIFRQTLTLIRDPHANARQHRLIADAMLRELRVDGLITLLQRPR